MACAINVALRPNAALPFHVVLPSINQPEECPFRIFHIKGDTTQVSTLFRLGTH
jgi:hypothetical protein